MGLTIHYKLKFAGTQEELAAALNGIRSKCLDLPFEEVGEVRTEEVTANTIKIWNWLQVQCCYPNNNPGNLSMRNLIMQELGVDAWTLCSLRDNKPAFFVRLDLFPGAGCAPSDLAFRRRSKRVWVCESFCKTQYAEQFAKCHLLVISLLDLLSANGFDVTVHDEGEYWDTRDIGTLAKNINESTAMLQSALGSLAASLAGTDMSLVAPITECKNYMVVEN